VELARNFTDDVEFSAEDATRTDWDYLEQISRAVVAAGARTVNSARHGRLFGSRGIWRLIGRMVRALGDSAIVSVHCHDDLGLAVANSIAAVQAGARQIECTINGIGERAGNVARRDRDGVQDAPDRLPFETKIVTEQIYSASQLLAQTITFGPQPNKAIVGENAFAHEAGIHQDEYLKERTTYEIIDPKTVGVPESKLVLGKHSGRHALSKRADDLGFQLNKEDLDVLYHRFITLADRKKGVRNEEIVAFDPRSSRPGGRGRQRLGSSSSDATSTY
jgi:2-isopropylmalate synthase